MLNIVWSGTFTKPCGKSNRLENKFPSVCFLLIDLQVPYPSKVDVEMREWGLIRGQNKSNMRSQNYHHSHGTGYTFITCNRSCQPQSLNQHHRPVKDHAGHWRLWVGSVFSEEYNFIFVLPPNLRTTPPAYPVYAKTVREMVRFTEIEVNQNAFPTNWWFIPIGHFADYAAGLRHALIIH